MDTGADIRRSTFVTSAGQPGVNGGLAGMGLSWDDVDMNDIVRAGGNIAQILLGSNPVSPFGINPATGQPYAPYGIDPATGRPNVAQQASIFGGGLGLMLLAGAAYYFLFSGSGKRRR